MGYAASPARTVAASTTAEYTRRCAHNSDVQFAGCASKAFYLEIAHQHEVRCAAWLQYPDPMPTVRATLSCARRLPWRAIVPFASAAVLIAPWERALGWPMIALVVAALVTAVIAAIHHAEVVAHRRE